MDTNERRVFNTRWSVKMKIEIDFIPRKTNNLETSREENTIEGKIPRRNFKHFGIKSQHKPWQITTKQGSRRLLLNRRASN
jgi:hypothetical protein